MTQAANLGALGTNVSSSGIAQAAGGGTAGTAGVTGFKNRIINGNFGIWQRGTSSSSAGYLADRWQLENTGTYAQSSDVPSGQGFPYSCTVSVTSGTAYGVIKQKIEAANCLDLVGKSATLSFWVKNLTGSTSMTAILYNANSVDNFGAVTLISSQSFTAVLNTWTKFTFNYNTLPAGTANGLQIYVFSADGSVAPSYLFTGCQFEAGTTATNFDFRSIGTELNLCQRYYEFGGIGNAVQFSGDVTSANNYFATIYLSVPKRVAPTIVNTSVTASSFPATASTASDQSASAFRNYRTSNATGNGAIFGDSWTASAEL